MTHIVETSDRSEERCRNGTGNANLPLVPTGPGLPYDDEDLDETYEPEGALNENLVDYSPRGFRFF